MKKLSIILTTIILVITAILFYWYEVRVSLIIKECNKQSAVVGDLIRRPQKPNNFQQPETYKEAYDLEYKQCLRDKGLDK